jgi:hypothetical protein
MKKINRMGKIIIATGLLHLFRRDEGFYGFGGYVDNTWGILTISLVLVAVGASMLLLSRKRVNDQ